ncbi:MAG: YbaN family protein [Actinomycetota bacterium]
MTDASITPDTSPTVPERGRIARFGWTMLGLLFVAIGAIGIVVPGLPTTVFFILAAWSFSKSSPRLEAWVLGLPKIGPMVQDHRDGLGMPRRAKHIAISMIVFFCTLSAFLVDGWAVRGAIAAAGLVGVSYIWFRVPTREIVLAQRASAAS